MTQRDWLYRSYVKSFRSVGLIAAGSACLLLSGCAGSHNVNMFGSYFPIWLICMILGVATAFGARALFVRLRIEPYVGPPTLIYLCIMIGASCLMWLVFS